MKAWTASICEFALTDENPSAMRVFNIYQSKIGMY